MRKLFIDFYLENIQMEIAKYAKPVRIEYLRRLKREIKDIDSLDLLIQKLKIGRHHGINFMNASTTKTIHEVKSTIELRVPNGTLEPTIMYYFSVVYCMLQIKYQKNF